MRFLLNARRALQFLQVAVKVLPLLAQHGLFNLFFNHLKSRRLRRASVFQLDDVVAELGFNRCGAYLPFFEAAQSPRKRL